VKEDHKLQLTFALSPLILANYFWYYMQNGECMKYLSLLIIVFISGCSSQPVSHQIADVIFGAVFEKVTDTDISHNAASCSNIKRTCSNGNYQEWYQNNGKLACACNK